MIKLSAFMIGVIVFFANVSRAESTLKIGSKAPELKPETWVQGQFQGFEKGQVYVVEFWGTWCGPCLQTLPHMVELKKEYSGRVNFVGVSAMSDTVADVQEFLNKFEPKIEYPTGVDTTDATWEAWLTASGAKGIPTAFVVDRDGTIAFIGYPTELDSKDLGNPLDQISAGTWRVSADFKKYEEHFTKEQVLSDGIAKAYDGYDEAKKNQDWAAALAAIEGGIALGQTDNLNDLLLQKADLLISHLGRKEEGYAMLPALIKENWGNVQGLGAILKLDPDMNRAHKSALRVLTLADFHPAKDVREKYRAYRWLLYPAVAQFYSRAGLPSLAVYYHYLAQISAVVAERSKEDTDKMHAEMAKYKEEQSGCKDGICALPKKDSEKDPLELLLEHVPTNEREMHKIFEKGGHLPKVEVLAAPSSVRDNRTATGEAVLYAIAGNAEAHITLRRMSIEVLGEWKSEAAVPLLTDIIEQGEVERAKGLGPYERKNENLTEFAARALGQIGDQTASPLLRKMVVNATLQNRDRRSAIWALGEMESKDAVPDLIKFLEAESEKTDSEFLRDAALALEKIGDERALKPLRAAINKRPDANTLFYLGSAAAEIGVKLADRCELLMAKGGEFKNRPFVVGPPTSEL